MKINVETTVAAPIEQVWRAYTTPADIKQWNAASDDWHTTAASVDLREGGAFSSRMEAKDGSMGFDFEGTYDKVEPNVQIAYMIADGRKVNITFAPEGERTKIVETFEAETTHSVDMQRDGWQAILNNFKKYTDSN